MSNTVRFSASTILLVALAAVAPAAMALGLGNISVDSYLNQPLKARIEMIVREGDDIDSVTASLASAEDYAMIGADLNDISVPLGFTVEQTDAGTYIQVSSRLAVTDPILRLIVEINWSSGRMLREYTVFLDPPTNPAPAPSPQVSERASTTSPASMPVAQQQDIVADERAAPRAGMNEGAEEYGPVQGGDTLWRIASDWAGNSGADLNAVMLAIQRNNPQAFINNNINLLKKGVVLRMPQGSELAGISASEARDEVQQQTRAFASETVTPAVETPLVDTGSEFAEEAVEEALETPEGQLELVPPSETADIDSAYGLEESSEGAEASTSVEALREELARTEEELIVEQQQNQNLKDRITELESQLASAEQGNVKDEALSQMERQLREDRLSGGGAAASGAETPAPPKVQTQRPEKEEHWYNSVVLWIIVLLVGGAAAAGWILSRRTSGDVLVTELSTDTDETVRGIKGEAEEILKVLKPAPGAKAAPQKAPEPAVEDTGAEEKKEEAKPQRRGHSDEAKVLDEDNADPEVRLDLARAYIAMGDKEAARVILDEVIQHGNEAQSDEAKAMLGEI